MSRYRVGQIWSRFGTLGWRIAAERFDIYGQQEVRIEHVKAPEITAWMLAAQLDGWCASGTLRLIEDVL